MNFSFWTFFFSLSCRPHYQLFPRPPSFFTTAVGSFGPCSEPNEDAFFATHAAASWSSRTRDTDAEEGQSHNVSPRGEISQIIAPQCPEDTCNHWGRGVRVTTLSSTGALSISSRLPWQCSQQLYCYQPALQFCWSSAPVAILPLEPKDFGAAW